MSRKEKFLEKLVKAQEKGWEPKDKNFIHKLSCLPEDIFEEALDGALTKDEEVKGDEDVTQTPVSE